MLRDLQAFVVGTFGEDEDDEEMAGGVTPEFGGELAGVSRMVARDGSDVAGTTIFIRPYGTPIRSRLTQR